jgi:hypothetical protein
LIGRGAKALLRLLDDPSNIWDFRSASAGAGPAKASAKPPRKHRHDDLLIADRPILFIVVTGNKKRP